MELLPQSQEPEGKAAHVFRAGHQHPHGVIDPALDARVVQPSRSRR